MTYGFFPRTPSYNYEIDWLLIYMIQKIHRNQVIVSMFKCLFIKDWKRACKQHRTQLTPLERNAWAVTMDRAGYSAMPGEAPIVTHVMVMVMKCEVKWISSVVQPCWDVRQQPVVTGITYSLLTQEQQTTEVASRTEKRGGESRNSGTTRLKGCVSKALLD